MFKKVTTLTALLALFLLAFAPLVLAQSEDAGETPVGETEPTLTPPEGDPPTQPPPPDSPHANEAPGSPLDLEDPISLVSDKIVIDCVVVFQNLAQLEQLRDAQASDPAFQLELARTEDFAQLCLDSGFTTPDEDAAPADSSSDNASSENIQETTTI
jgi:hypothetical protein